MGGEGVQRAFTVSEMRRSKRETATACVGGRRGRQLMASLQIKIGQVVAFQAFMTLGGSKNAKKEKQGRWPLTCMYNLCFCAFVGVLALCVAALVHIHMYVLL